MQTTNRLFYENEYRGFDRPDIKALFRQLGYRDLQRLKEGDSIWFRQEYAEEKDARKVRGFVRARVKKVVRALNALSIAYGGPYREGELLLTGSKFAGEVFGLAPGKTEGDLERLAASAPYATLPMMN